MQTGTQVPQITLTSDITVRLVQSVGSDAMVVAAAKVSTSGEEALGFTDTEANYGLINFLMKHRHGSVFEHGQATFFVHAPIFVWREWHRHRIGFCLAGDTQIWAESFGKNNGRTLRKHSLKELHDRWVNGVHDTKGRVRFLDSVKNQRLRVLNEDTGYFELGGIEDITQSGIKECLLVEADHPKGHHVRCSADHRILTDEGWVRAGDLTAASRIAVNGKKSMHQERQIPPALRQGIGIWTSGLRDTLIPEITNCYVCGGVFHREDLVLDHVIPVVECLKLALDTDNLKPACTKCHRVKTNSEQVLAQRGNLAAARFVRLKRKPYYVSEEMTYDIAMKPPWHNFIANGIVVHNSYNEESARYKPLDPVFWIPRRDRAMIPVDGWKPGRPKFRTLDQAASEMIGVPDYKGHLTTADAWYEREIARDRESYEVAYGNYLASLEDGFALEVARCKLPVAIYSSCWVTTNPRALMAFLSLRTHDPDAKYVSYPQQEIEEAARACEVILSEGWPLTYRSFCENGRVGP